MLPGRKVYNAFGQPGAQGFPTDEEVKITESYAKSVPSKREATTDLAWALINSAEFLYRH